MKKPLFLGILMLVMVFFPQLMEAQSDVFTETVANVEGCIASESNAMVTGSLPTAAFINGDGDSICSSDPASSAGLDISLTGTAPFTFELAVNHDTVLSMTAQSNHCTFYVAPPEQTTYRITMVRDAYYQNTNLGPEATATVYVKSIEFENNVFESECDNPGVVTINFNMICGNPTAMFTVVYDNGLQASGNISNNTATFAAPTASGDYNAVFTVDGCSYVITIKVNPLSTSVIDNQPTVDFRVYPNPTSDIVNVQLTMNNEQLGGMSVQVFDVFGRLLNVVELGRALAPQTAQIDLSKYAKGVYFVNAVSEGKVIAVRKVVKW